MKGTFGAFVTVPSPRIPLFTRHVRAASKPEEREESGATSATVEQTVESVDPVASEGPSYAAFGRVTSSPKALSPMASWRVRSLISIRETISPSAAVLPNAWGCESMTS